MSSAPALDADATESAISATDDGPLLVRDVTTETEAATILTEVQEHTEMMLNQAQLQVTTWQEEARQTGWQLGYSEAHQAAEAELVEALTTARDLAHSAKAAHDEFLRKSHAELGQLAVAIAKKIIGNELTLNPNAITDIVAQVIKTANIRGACCIRVNPEDFEIIEPHWQIIPALQPSGQTWELAPDQRIKRGGCLIETGGGTIDAQLETQLEQVIAAFRA